MFPSFGQELLWEAGRAETATGDSSQVSSPETAARKRAAALESRRFLAAMAEAEARRHANVEDTDDGGDAESKMEVSVRGQYSLVAPAAELQSASL